MTHAPNPVMSKLMVTLLAATATSCASIPHPKEPSKLAAIRPVQTGPVAPPGAPADLLYADAANAILERDYGRALDLLQFAKQRDPKDIRVLNAFGVVYDKLGRFDLSARYYAQARALDPNSSIVVANLAYSQRLQRGEGDAERANAPTTMATTTPGPPAAAGVAPVRTALTSLPPTPLAPIPIVAPQPAPVLAVQAEAEPLRRIVAGSAPAAAEPVTPVRVALNPTPHSATLPSARAEAHAPRPSEPLGQIVPASAPAALERVKPVRVSLVPPAPPVLASRAVPTPQSAAVASVRAQASRSRTAPATRQAATAVKESAWTATGVAPKQVLAAIATSPRAPAVAAAPAAGRTRALNVSLVIPPIVTQSRSSFWARHSPLVLVNASGSQSRVETVRTHLV